MDRIRRRVVPALAVGTFVLACVSCRSGLPKRGGDGAQIRIGSPRVVSRERFIKDRLKDLNWLRDRLESNDYTAGRQGDVRAFTLDSSSAALRLRANLVKALAPLGDMAEQTPDPAPSGDGATNQASDPNGSGSGSEGNQPVPNAVSEMLDGLAEGILTEILNGDGPTIEATLADQLDDDLAFRDAVRNAIRQRALDDTHDLYGNTLHELTFDLSLFPGHDSGDPYVVVAEVQPGSTPSETSAQALLRSFRAYAAEESNRRASRIKYGATTADVGWLTAVEDSAQLAARAEQHLEAFEMMQAFHNATSSARKSLKGPWTDHEKIAEQIWSIPEAKSKILELRIPDEVQLSRAIKAIEPNAACALPPEEPMDPRESTTELARAYPSVPGAVERRIRADAAELSKYLQNMERDYRDLAIVDVIIRHKPQAIAAKVPELEQNMQQMYTAQLHSIGPEAMTESVIEPLRTPTVAIPIMPILADPGEWFEYKATLVSLIDGDPIQGFLNVHRAMIAAVDTGHSVVEATGGALELDDSDPVVRVVESDGDKPGASFFPRLRVTNDASTLTRFINSVDPDQAAYASSIMPTEAAETYSVDLSSLIRRAFDLDVSAVLGTQVDGGLVTQQLREELLRINQLERQPLVVGFTGTRSSGSTFGWMIGPRLEARQPKPPLDFLPGPGVEEWQRQIAVHHPVTVTIVAPAQQDMLRLQVSAYRIAKNGAWISANHAFALKKSKSNSSESKDEYPNLTMDIELPIDGDAYARGVVYGNDRLAGAPSVIRVHPTTLVSGKPGNLLVHGDNLWRSPEVYVGGQKARDTTPLADLNGLHVEMDALALRPGTYDVAIVTSAGQDVRSEAITVLAGASSAWLNNTDAHKIASGGTLRLGFRVTPPLSGWSSFKLRALEGSKEIFDLTADLEQATNGGSKILIGAKKVPDNIAGTYDIDLYVTPDPRSDPVRMTRGQRLTLVGQAWVERTVTGKGKVEEKSATDKTRVLKAGTEVVFTYGAVTWKQVGEAFGWKETAAKLITGALNGTDLELVEAKESDLAAIKLKVAASKEIKADSKITLDVGGIKLNLKMPK